MIDKINVGDKVYRYLSHTSIIIEYEYLGNNKFSEVHADRIIFAAPSDFKFLYYTYDGAACAMYLYKLNKLQTNIAKFTKDLHSTTTALNELNEKFGYLKDKYPEEFI